MGFPDSCLRGIKNDSESYLVGGMPTMNLFLFDFDKETNKWKQSINWEDDEHVVAFTLTQKKDDDTFRYKCGVARIGRAKIDGIRSLPQVKGLLSYNREPLEGINPHHGNLILEGETLKHVRGLIASALALACDPVIYREI